MGPGPDVIIAYCSGPDCLCTRKMHLDPVDVTVVLCDYCGRAFLKRQVICVDTRITLDKRYIEPYTSP